MFSVIYEGEFQEKLGF